MEPFAIKGNLKYYSRRPPVSYVTKWEQLYNKYAENNWRGLNDCHLTVEEAEFIPCYYKVTSIINGQKKVKYFYGETSWANVRRYAGDLGHYLN
jgi:hypothetical protein